MKRVRMVLVGCSLALAACNSPVATSDASTEVVQGTTALSNDDMVRLTGSGHHTRTVAGVSELTTFSFSAIGHKDGTASGQYQYNFQANGFAIHGPVTCLSRVGSQVWVGGVVDRVVTDNPAFETLQGLEMWWRSIDNGEGANAAPDVTTGVGFGFPGSTITAASWCANKPLSLVARAVENGNIQVH